MLDSVKDSMEEAGLGDVSEWVEKSFEGTVLDPAAMDDAGFGFGGDDNEEEDVEEVEEEVEVDLPEASKVRAHGQHAVIPALVLGRALSAARRTVEQRRPHFWHAMHNAHRAHCWCMGHRVHTHRCTIVQQGVARRREPMRRAAQVVQKSFDEVPAPNSSGPPLSLTVCSRAALAHPLQTTHTKHEPERPRATRVPVFQTQVRALAAALGDEGFARSGLVNAVRAGEGLFSLAALGDPRGELAAETLPRMPVQSSLGLWPPTQLVYRFCQRWH
jgi:hypothetical protein